MFEKCFFVSISLVGLVSIGALATGIGASERSPSSQSTDETSAIQLDSSRSEQQEPPNARPSSLVGGGSPSDADSGHINTQTFDTISHRLDRVEQKVSQIYDTRIPFWNIAHMINKIDQVELALSAGSNGIETDVSFNSRGLPIEAYHGFPCDCGRHCHHRSDFVEFVRHLARISVPPAVNRLYVVLFDLKLKNLKSDEQKQRAGLALAEIIHKNLFEPYQQAMESRANLTQSEKLLVQPPMRVILSINYAKDVALVKAFIKYMTDHRLDLMRQNVGYDVGMNDNLGQIEAAWNSLGGAAVNIWQGDGLTNCANIARGVKRLKEALNIRNKSGSFKKVYYWTADVMYHIRSIIRLGVDALLTNQPQRVVKVLKEDEFKFKFRLATPWDNPFEQISIQPTGSKIERPSLSEAVEAFANICEASNNYIKNIPDGFKAAAKRVQHSVGLC